VESKNLWNKCLDIIRDNVNDKAFNTWFCPIVPIKYEENDFTIQVPSHFFYEYIEEQYAHLIHATLTRLTGKNLVLNYRVFVDNSDKKKGHTTIQSDRNTSGIDPKKQINNLNKSPNPIVSPYEWNTHLNPRLSFRNFFEGPSNMLARRVGEAIVQVPGKTFNPFYIYGVSGVGKTHLCHAIGNQINELFPDKKVIYISSHLFQVQFTDASRNNTFNDFVNFYQGVDVLIIDDIQEFAGKEKTQNAYFHIFNHLHLLGKQLVLTSDKAPIDLQGLEERLITRMKWGMTAELQKPDLELRKKIIHYKIKQNGLNIPEEIVEYIAENITEHARDLEGVITSLVAYTSVYDKDADLDLAREIVGKTVKNENKTITPEKIQNIVSNYFNVDLKDIHSKSRKQEFVQARQITMFLCKKHTDYSYAHIGDLVGKRDHATVLYACRAIQNTLDVDKSFRTTMKTIENLLKK
jgi:chromosomal replication initiator protein